MLLLLLLLVCLLHAKPTRPIPLPDLDQGDTLLITWPVTHDLRSSWSRGCGQTDVHNRLP